MKVRGTLIGFTAILMWSLLALMTAASGTMPPFQLAAITFAIGSLPGVLLLAVKPERIKLLRQPPKVWLIGIGGLFGYHALYFTALRNAPAVEAGLIAYLWPLLIVVGSALLPGERLRWFMWPVRLPVLPEPSPSFPARASILIRPISWAMVRPFSAPSPGPAIRC